MYHKTTADEPAPRAAETLRAERARQWAELLLRWAYFLFEVARWAA